MMLTVLDDGGLNAQPIEPVKHDISHSTGRRNDIDPSRRPLRIIAGSPSGHQHVSVGGSQASAPLALYCTVL